MGTSSPRDASWEVDQQIADRVLACMPRDMTQTALSKATGIPESTLSRYLHPSEATGRIRGTPAAALLSIARALGVTICELYGVEEGHTGARGESVSDRFVESVTAELGQADRELLGEIGASLERYRARLRREEGLT
jgi:transcriptional regulator with XRE-family HTH domain